MDFKKLSEMIPKHPNSWSLEDVGVWLDFIGLSQFKPQFSINLNVGEKAIDGSCIFLLEDEDLKDDVKITSNIVRKKILNWTKSILIQYGNFLIQNKIVQDRTQMEIENYKQEVFQQSLGEKSLASLNNQIIQKEVIK